MIGTVMSTSSDEAALEQRLADGGASSRRLTPELIDQQIRGMQFHQFFDTTTVCCLRLSNGFTVVGESACVDPNNFRKEIGQEVAFKNAREKIWQLEGYLLRQRLWEQEQQQAAKQQFQDEQHRPDLDPTNSIKQSSE